MDELELDPTSSSRRLLAQSTGPPPNSSLTLMDDAKALLLIKEAILYDPYNITYWWKPQGKKHALNPCKVLNGTNDFWPGIDCSDGEDRRVIGVDLSNKGLNGTLSPAFGQLGRLQYLNLSNNFFSGPIPLDLGMAFALETLDLSNNRLEGAVPPTLGDVNNLTSVLVSNNRLSGSIPSEFGSLQVLTTLNMSGNNLTGPIPVELNSCTGLTTVDLSKNGPLQGRVPFLNLANLTVLHLQDNQLEGNFVSNLGTFQQLSDVDVSNNNLDGIIPTSIGTLPLRTQLSLQRNKLNGTIPNELGNLALVLRIDLSGNQLTGSLPDQVSGLNSLRQFDISKNRLNGSLPRNLIFLSALESFNGSHNGFNGSLPSLARVSTLQTFDASYNNFSGSIPENFVNFTTLTYLNVSNNALSGEVPTFVAHDSVNKSSFLNNLQLCGDLLGVNCRSSGTSNKVVSISVGCSVAAAAVLVLLVLIRRRRSTSKGRSSATVSAELQMELSPEDILRITNNFAHTIGVGSKSTVYRGVLADGTVVAVKRFGIRRGEIDDAAEKVLASGFETLGPIRHWASVKVLAYCSSPDIKALVMEYLPNGNLRSVLHPPLDASSVRVFNWNQRFEAAIVIAEGLKYLHHECQPTTVHGDLKPSNILFNTFREPRLADFALAKIQGLGVGKSAGYTAPEPMPQGGTIKGDVYSFGIVLLEIISGRSPQSLEQGQQLPHWVRGTISNSKSLQTVLDPILMSDMRTQQQRMAMVLGVALLCTRGDPVERPYITEVLKMLNHIKARPQEGSKSGSSSVRLRTSLSTHQRNEEIRQEVPGIEIERSPPDTPGALPTNPSLSHWTPSAHER